MKNSHLLPPQSSTGLKGVYKAPSQSKKPYRSQITCPKSGRKIFLGYFNSKKEAGVAYDEKAWQIYGPNAYFNFITTNPELLDSSNS